MGGWGGGGGIYPGSLVHTGGRDAEVPGGQPGGGHRLMNTGPRACPSPHTHPPIVINTPLHRAADVGQRDVI